MQQIFCVILKSIFILLILMNCVIIFYDNFMMENFISSPVSKLYERKIDEKLGKCSSFALNDFQIMFGHINNVSYTNITNTDGDYFHVKINFAWAKYEFEKVYGVVATAMGSGVGKNLEWNTAYADFTTKSVNIQTDKEFDGISFFVWGKVRKGYYENVFNS